MDRAFTYIFYERRVCTGPSAMMIYDPYHVIHSVVITPRTREVPHSGAPARTSCSHNDMLHARLPSAFPHTYVRALREGSVPDPVAMLVLTYVVASDLIAADSAHPILLQDAHDDAARSA